MEESLWEENVKTVSGVVTCDLRQGLAPTVEREYTATVKRLYSCGKYPYGISLGELKNMILEIYETTQGLHRVTEAVLYGGGIVDTEVACLRVVSACCTDIMIKTESIFPNDEPEGPTNQA